MERQRQRTGGRGKIGQWESGGEQNMNSSTFDVWDGKGRAEVWVTAWNVEVSMYRLLRGLAYLLTCSVG